MERKQNNNNPIHYGSVHLSVALIFLVAFTLPSLAQDYHEWSFNESIPVVWFRTFSREPGLFLQWYPNGNGSHGAKWSKKKKVPLQDNDLGVWRRLQILEDNLEGESRFVAVGYETQVLVIKEDLEKIRLSSQSLIQFTNKDPSTAPNVGGMLLRVAIGILAVVLATMVVVAVSICYTVLARCKNTNDDSNTEKGGHVTTQPVEPLYDELEIQGRTRPIYPLYDDIVI